MNLLTDSCNEYEYAVPSEMGKLLPNQLSPLKSIPNSPAALNRGNQHQQRVNLYQRFKELGVPEIPSRNLKMLRKLGDGAFGTVSQAHYPTLFPYHLFINYVHK